MSAIFLSSGSFKTKSSREVVNIALRHGFTHVELSSGMDFSEEFLNPIRSTKDKINFIVHNYFPPPRVPFVLNLASTDATIRQLSIDMAEAAIRLSVVLGAPFYSVHSGFVVNLSPEDLGKPERQADLAEQQKGNYEEAYQIFVDSVGHLTEYAKGWGIQVLVKNNVVTPASLRAGVKNQFLMIKADEFERLRADVPNDNLGFLIDLAHLDISANALYFNKLYFLERIRAYIACLHLSGNNGQQDTNELITPVSWFMPLLKTFADIPMVVEVFNLTPEQMRQQLDLVTRYRHGTGTLISRDD